MPSFNPSDGVDVSRTSSFDAIDSPRVCLDLIEKKEVDASYVSEIFAIQATDLSNFD